jgi:hypothetical protein
VSVSTIGDWLRSAARPMHSGLYSGLSAHALTYIITQLSHHPTNYNRAPIFINTVCDWVEFDIDTALTECLQLTEEKWS